MPHPTVALIERRASASRFDRYHTLTDGEIEGLIDLATRAPTAYNLQNWRFIAARTSMAKSKLLGLAYGQAKVLHAAVTFIVCGQLPDYTLLHIRLYPFVEAGFMAPSMASDWQQRVRDTYSNDPISARDEAIRSATFGAATLIFAAEAMGLVSGPMAGFDVNGVTREFSLARDEIPVMLLPVGRAAQGNWPQKPRRPLDEVMQIA